VATGVGVYLALAPFSVLSTLVLWALIVYFSRYVSLGSIIATAAVPLWTLLYYGLLQPSPHLKALVIIGVIGCALIVAKHHENINRLIHGKENKIGSRVKPDNPSTPDGAMISGGRN
jgi:glycerol-3-phosphate acyltransferase PlsY